jgi:NADH dehydrogenase
MKVLVTGGTGVVGEAVVRELHGAGHSVRVLTRHAGRDQKWWPHGVDGWAGDISSEKSIRGAAEGCDAVVHIAGIVEEKPPAITFQSVNIDGTRYTVLEAERAGVKKFIYVSSLGADTGESEYHKSKFVAEDVVKQFSRDWVILRPGAVYGPGDEHLSVLLRMVRTLPVIPTIGDGNQKFQPIWHEDFAKAVRASVEKLDIKCVVLEVAGNELSSQNELCDRFRKLTDRPAVQAPVPEFITKWAIKALDAVGVDVNFTEGQLEMLTEGNHIDPGKPNALTSILGVTPTPLDKGLRRLVDEQPEQLPSEGVGTLTRKRFWVDITGAKMNADALFDHVRANLSTLMPPLVGMKAEPGASTRIEEGETLTLEIPLRGHIQVRVGEVMDRRITLLTVAGHPIAGAVRFLVEPRSDGVRFEIQVYDRPASTIDRLLMRTAGEYMQRAQWVGLAENVAQAAGGSSTDVRREEVELDDKELELVDAWVQTLSAQLSRKSASGARS